MLAPVLFSKSKILFINLEKDIKKLTKRHLKRYLGLKKSPYWDLTKYSKLDIIFINLWAK